MTEERDPFREYVEQEVGNKKWKCKLCGGEFAGRTSRILPHLAGIRRQNIRPCLKVDREVKEEASRVFERTKGTSGTGTEGTVSGASQSVAPSQGASNSNDVQNSNRPGCAPQQPSFDPPTGTGTAPACPQDQEPLRSSMPQELIKFFASSSLDINALLELPEQSIHDVIMPDAPLYSDQSNLDDLLSEDFDESLATIFFSEEREADELHNPAVVSSLQIDSSLDVDGANRLQGCGQPRGVEVVPDPSNRSPTDIVQHPGQLPPRCDKEDGNDIRRFPSQTPMVIDPSTALQHPSDSHFFDARKVHLRVQGASTDPIGPSSSHASVPPQCQIVPHRSINLETVHQNPTVPSSSWENRLVTGHPQALMDMDPCMPSSSQAPNNAPPPPQILPCGTGLIGPSSLPELDMNEGAPMTSHPNTGSNLEKNRDLKRKLELLYRKEASIRDELEFAASLSLKKPRMEVANWLANVEKLRNDCPRATSETCWPPHQQVDILMHEAEDFTRQGKGLVEARESKVNKLLEDEMVGEAFQRNTTKILEYLVGNQISRLGIYGMGGVGKTTIMVHIHNRLLEEANYGNVLWITVSQDFNTQKLQDELWKVLDLGIPQENDVRKRATKLWDCLMKKGKSTIMLDDVWEPFDPKEVGIPIGADEIKLVLTTRSLDVCRQMKCQEMIKIEPLSHTEAEGLFLEELGFEVGLNLETNVVVESIVKECAGLPLAIITMARSMRRVTDVFEWTNYLERLRESDMGQTDMEKVLKKLEFSYNLLGDREVQQCFLSCALYSEDKLISKFELIEFFIDQGMFGRLNTREKQYARGLTILNKLENACLLEDHEGKMKMHDIIRDMALHIMSLTSIVQPGKGLRTIPFEEYWTDALEKVSLMENYIGEFPLNMSPNCPKLSTFLLNANRSNNVVIHDSFFKKLWGLKVLNLSGCNLRKLPDSISDLENLTALLIRKCLELRCIPCLGKLRLLRKLDAVCCVKLEEIKGLKKLENLTYLDIAHTRIKTLPKGTLGATLKLQYLSVQAVSEEDIIKLQALETLKCQFEDVDDFNKLVRMFSKQENTPRYYKLNMGHQPPPIHVDFDELAHFEHCESRYYKLNMGHQPPPIHVDFGELAHFEHYERSVHIGMRNHAIVSAGGESSGGSICILIPQDVRVLIASDCKGTTNLFGMGPLKNLEELTIIAWENLGVLCLGQDDEIIDIHDSPAPTPAPLLFRSLRVLTITSCWKLKYLFRHGPKFSLPLLQKITIVMCVEMVGITVATSPPHLPPAFPNLEEIKVADCRKMKRVVESEWLPHFPKLKIIEVAHSNIEEIIGVPPPYMLVEEISLEQLRVSCCHNMRKLFSHEWMLYLRNLQTIDVRICREMVEMISGVGQAQEGSITTPVNNTPSSSSQSSISLPELKQLELCRLPHLKSICEVPITCDSMEHLSVFDCPKLNKIPLQLQLRDIENLPYIKVESEEKWKTLIWDHPHAQAILQPHLLFRDSLCVLEGRGRCNSLYSPRWM